MISRTPKTLTEVLKSLPIVGTLNVDTNTFIAKDEMTAIEIAAVSGYPLMGEQLMDEAIKEVSLDRWLDHSPKLNTPKDYEELVANLQHKRQMFISAEQKKREPKVEGEDTNETTN